MSLMTAMFSTWKNGRLSREKLAALQKKRLRSLVRFARENSPYYRKLYAGVPEDFALSDLPPTSKPEMMAALDDVLTDRSVTRQRIDDYTRDPNHIGRMLDGKYLIFRTSGSTGHPATVLYDKNCIDVSSAVAALRTFARREDLQAFLRHGKKTAGVFADHGFYLACGMSRYLQLRMPGRNTKITVDVNLPEDEIVRRLNAFQPAMLSGYPSNLGLLADHGELTIRPDAVITGGELLTDALREKLHKKFGCTVQTHYSCTEGGEIACECAEGHLHINEDWVILEAVDAKNHPVPCGTLSDKVLITNLANRIQPFIRYELTDRVVVHDEPCPCGRTLIRMSRLTGRTDDMLVIRGVNVFPSQIEACLVGLEGVAPFYMLIVDRVNSTDKLEVQIEMSEEMFTDKVSEIETLRNTIAERIKSIVGIAAKVTLVPPKSLPRSEGKAKRIIDNRNLRNN